MASVLEEHDRLAATYRGHGHALALGVDPQALLDEMLGRATGTNGAAPPDEETHGTADSQPSADRLGELEQRVSTLAAKLESLPDEVRTLRDESDL